MTMCDEPSEQDRIASTWTDGPDSQAARGARGEGPAMCRATLDAVSEILHSRCNRGEPGRTDAKRGWDAAMMSVIHLVGMLWADGRVHWSAADWRPPGPDYTPAVRRVAAWIGDEDEAPRLDPEDAYADAVDIVISRAFDVRNRLSTTSERDFMDHFGDGRRARLATMLRRRDEKSGHR